MVTFHTSVMESPVQHLSDWALQNLVQLPGARAFSQPLSEIEKTPVSRALYRYQICCNLFGLRDGQTEDPCFEAVEGPTFQTDHILEQLGCCLNLGKLRSFRASHFSSNANLKPVLQSFGGNCLG